MKTLRDIKLKVGFMLAHINPFKPEFTIVIFIHYTVVNEDDLMWFEIKENCHVLVNQFHGNFCSKTLGCRKIKSVYRDVR